MSKLNFLNDLVSQISQALPTHVDALKKDFEKQCQTILTTAFTKFDIVTREEFDTQSKVLARTREKMEALEAKIKAFESQQKT